MYQGSYLDLKWQRVLLMDQIDTWSTLKFSKEGSRIAFYSQTNRALVLINSSDGSFVAGNQKIRYNDYNNDVQAQTNIEVSYNSSSGRSTIYGQFFSWKNDVGGQPVKTIVKFEDNASNNELVLKWIKFMKAESKYVHPVYYMKFVDHIKGFLDSYTCSSKGDYQYLLQITNFNLDGLVQWVVEAQITYYYYNVQSFKQSDQDFQYIIFDGYLIHTINVVSGNILLGRTKRLKKTNNDFGEFVVQDSVALSQHEIKCVAANITNVIYFSLDIESDIMSGKIFKLPTANSPQWQNVKAIFRDIFQDSFFVSFNGENLIRFNQSDQNLILRYNFTENSSFGFLLFSGYPSRNIINQFQLERSFFIKLDIDGLRNDTSWISISEQTPFYDPSYQLIANETNFQEYSLSSSQLLDIRNATDTENKFKISYNFTPQPDNPLQSLYQFNWTQRCTNSQKLWTSEEFDIQIKAENGSFYDVNKAALCSTYSCSIKLDFLIAQFGYIMSRIEFEVKLKPKYSSIDRWSTMKSSLISTPIIENITGYIQTGPYHSAINYNLAISRFEASNLTDKLNITEFKVYYDGLNVSTSKYLASISDLDIATMSQVYVNSTILDVFKDQYFRVSAVNLLGEGSLSNYTLVQRYNLVPEGYLGTPQMVYKTINNQTFVIFWAHQGISKFLTFYQIRLYNEYQQRPIDIQTDCNGSSSFVISQKACEVSFSELEKYQFEVGQRIITSIDYCNPNGCKNYDFFYPLTEIRYLTVPYAAPTMIIIEGRKTNFTSIAMIWSGLEHNMKGSGGITCDFKIWYRNNDTLTTKILLTNSTNGNLNYQTSTQQFVHKQYTQNIFEIQPFNYLGEGKISGNLTFMYDVPEQPSAPYCSIINKTAIRIRFDQQTYDQTNYQELISYDFYQKNVSYPASQYFWILKAEPPGYNSFDFLLTQKIQNGQKYLFKYKTQNYVGYSSFSNETLIVAGFPPSPQGSIITSNEGKFVRITWENAFDLQELPVIGFNITILDNNGSWATSSSLMKHCNSTDTNIISQMYCIVPMEVFTEKSSNGGSFQLKAGSIIQPQVTVYNVIGSCSNVISMQNINSIVFDIALAPKNPISVIESQSNSKVASLTILGQKQISSNYDPVVSYQVFLFKDETYQLIQNLSVNASESISFNFSYNASQTYNFSYSIRQFGRSIGYYNNSITFKIPSQICNLTVRFDSWTRRKIQIYASEIFSQQFNLDNYELQGQNVMSKWVAIEGFYNSQCSKKYNGSRNNYLEYDCETSKFLQHPLNLQIGDNIKIRMRANNFVGWSDFYQNTDTFKVISKPIGRVWLFQNLQSNDMEAIEIIWTELEFPEDGGDSTYGFTVFWGEGSPGAEWKVLAEFSSPVFKANTKDFGVKTSINTYYKFKVQAFNSQGHGPESLAFYARTPQKQKYSDSEGVTYLFASFLMLIYSYC